MLTEVVPCGSKVIDSIHALGRCAQKNGFQGPVIGVKLAEANKREFSPEQLKAGEGVIGLQAGEAPHTLDTVSARSS